MVTVRHLPSLGVLAAIATMVAATWRYPGGTQSTADTVGFRWSENFVCELFDAQAQNGAENAARPLGITGLLLLCVSLAVVFFAISRSTTSRRHRSAIEIGGIGAAVYAMFVPTPIHNVVIAVGGVFSFVAFVAIGHLMWLEQRHTLLWCGACLVALQAINSIVYYGNVGYAWLPVLQKMGIALGLGWLLAVRHRCTDPNRREPLAP
jgi:hypothetical protein